MKIVYSTKAKEDREFWQKTRPKLLERIDKLIQDIQKHPFSGLGKLEALKFQKSQYWSRRITQEVRLVYKIADNCIYIAQCRYHYS